MANIAASELESQTESSEPGGALRFCGLPLIGDLAEVTPRLLHRRHRLLESEVRLTAEALRTRSGRRDLNRRLCATSVFSALQFMPSWRDTAAQNRDAHSERAARLHLRRAGCMRTLRSLSAIGLIIAAALLARAERLPLKIYTTADGLGHENVSRIVRDSRGFLWFCTFEGLSRFDGYGFTTYGIDQGLPSAVVNDLLETRKGEYWVSTGAGLCRFNPRGIAQPHHASGEQQPASSNAMFTVYSPSPGCGLKECDNALRRPKRRYLVWDC